MEDLNITSDRETGYVPLVVLARAQFDGGPDQVLMERRMSKKDGSIYTHRPETAPDIGQP